MADVKEITMPSGTVYQIKDEVARSMASGGDKTSRCNHNGSYR